MNQQHLLSETENGGGVATFDLDGLTCSSCVNAVRNALDDIPQIANLRIALFPTPHLKADLEDKRSVDVIVDTVESIGFGCKLRMYQPKQASLTSKEWKPISVKFPSHVPEIVPFGIRIVKLNGQILEMEYNSTVFPGKRSVMREFDECELVEHDSTSSNDSESRRTSELLMWRFRTIVALLFAMPCMLLSMTMTGPRWFVFALATVVMFYSGMPFHREAFSSKHKFGMALLVSLGSSCAYFFSLFVLLYNALNEEQHQLELMDTSETSAVLIAFVVLGKYLECTAKHKTSDAIAQLAKLQPSTAILVVENKEQEISTALLEPGDVCRVPRGARVPADGLVIEGHFTVDESMLSGESLPVQKQRGSNVWTGTIPSQPFVMQVQHTGSDTAVSRIVQMVENAQGTRAPIERMADEISSRFVPFILCASLTTMLIWTVLLQTGIAENYEANVPDVMLPFLFALSVLVVACPCALGLATPTAVMVGCGIAAQYGVLIKSGTALEMFARVNCIVFDKTGTLTRGVLAVEQIHTVNGSTESEVISFAALAERNSDHPTALAVVKYAQNTTLQTPPINVKETSGMGITCETVQGDIVKVGNPRFFTDHSQLPDVQRAISLMESKGCTTIVVEVNGKILGLIGLRDEAKEDAACSVAALQALGCEVFMLTGDNFSTAHIVASEVGIDAEHVMASVLPNEKAEAVQGLQNQKRVIAFVGDGINDAPALSVADVGVAIGAGTQIAIEAADMVLMNSKLVDVVTALDLSRVVFRRIKINFGFALAYNTLGIVITCGLLYPWDHVVLPAWIAAGAMALSSVSVVTSSLALRWYRAPKVVPKFGYKRTNGRGVDMDSIEVILSSGAVVLRKNIEVGCNVLQGGQCACSPCHCKTCDVHCKG